MEGWVRCPKPPACQKFGLVFRLCQSYYPRRGKAHLQVSRSTYTTVEEAEAAKRAFRRWVKRSKAHRCTLDQAYSFIRNA